MKVAALVKNFPTGWGSFLVSQTYTQRLTLTYIYVYMCVCIEADALQSLGSATTTVWMHVLRVANGATHILLATLLLSLLERARNTTRPDCGQTSRPSAKVHISSVLEELLSFP